MLDAFGTPSRDFEATTLGQLLEAMNGRGAAKESAVNATVAAVGGAEPANSIGSLRRGVGNMA